jgi:leucyl/phenylalanyl-tRNA--protein transferase
MQSALLTSSLNFPDPGRADGEGLVAVGGDMSVERLLLAYRSGIFPWTANPVTWWSPDPRAIFQLERFHVSRSLAKVIRRGDFQITTDRAFRQVMEGCAAPARGRRSTWISDEFFEAYTRLHEQGHAHSLECWFETRGQDFKPTRPQDYETRGLKDDKTTGLQDPRLVVSLSSSPVVSSSWRLVGGIYGVAIGGFFAGESMFHRASNASKVALFHLVSHLRTRGFVLLDIQTLTSITKQLGGITIPREEYLRRLAHATKMPCSF